MNRIKEKTDLRLGILEVNVDTASNTEYDRVHDAL